MSNIELMTERELVEMLRVSKNSARQFGQQCGARIRIGRVLRYDRQIILNALEAARD